MLGSYNNFTEVIKILHLHNIDYVIMRNFSNLLSDELYITGHPDIDILCADSIELAKAIKAKQYRQDDITHYYIFINNNEVSLDLRYIGDGYYPTNWQITILKNKVMHPNGFYIMDKENYLYSLTYHAIVQKKTVSIDYIDILVDLSANIGLKIDVQNKLKNLVTNLEKWMYNCGYNYTYAKDKTVYLNKKHISKQLIKKDYKLRFKHWKFDVKVWIIEELVKIKHFLKF